jgi:hypothetical protein
MPFLEYNDNGFPQFPNTVAMRAFRSRMSAASKEFHPDGKRILGSLGAGSHKGDGPKGRSRNQMRGQQRVAAAGQKAAMTMSHSPQLGTSVITHNTTLRFRSNAAAVTSVTFQNLLDTILFATTAVAGSDLFQTVRIKRVRLWAVPIIGGTATVSCEYAGVTAGLVGDQNVHSDMSMGVQPAHVDCRPNARSLAADFQVSSAATAFTINVPAGAVIDVELTFRGQFAVNVAAANALVGATAGAVYLCGLDGLAIAATLYVPELSLLGYVQ